MNLAHFSKISCLQKWFLRFFFCCNDLHVYFCTSSTTANWFWYFGDGMGRRSKVVILTPYQLSRLGLKSTTTGILCWMPWYFLPTLPGQYGISQMRARQVEVWTAAAMYLSPLLALGLCSALSLFHYFPPISPLRRTRLAGLLAWFLMSFCNWIQCLLTRQTS